MGHALITAGTKGLGLKVTEAFLENGHCVTVTYHQDYQRAKELKEKYPDLHIVQADITKINDLQFVYNQAKKHFGTIDFLINNVGPFIFERKKLMDYSQEEWDTMIRGNLDAVFSLLKLTIPAIALEEAEYGITSNMVCPGNIVGEMKEASIEKSRQMPDENTPIGRSGTGEDIARIIQFLCQKDSDMITGAIFDVTGGLDVINRYR